MNSANKLIRPFYFGDPAQQLYGVYHLPENKTKNCGIILNYPIGHEYIQFHRAYRELSIRLAKAGFHVLRFDYYGCGDSSGSSTDGNMADWVKNVSAAIDDMKTKHELNHICLVGLRLGATISLLTSAERDDINSMVLFDPVCDGKLYIDELKSLHRDMLLYAHVKEKNEMPGDEVLEILGFPYTDDLLSEFKKIEITSDIGKHTNNTLIIETHDKYSQKPLTSLLMDAGVNVEYKSLPNEHLWTWVEDFSRVLVPHPLLNDVVNWLSGVYE